MLFSRRRGNECDNFEIALDGTSLFRGSCIDVIKSRLRKNLKAPASSRIMPFLKGEINNLIFLCVLTPHFFFSVNSFLKPLSPYFPLPCSTLDWPWGKGRKDVFIQYITKFINVQSHVSFKNLELVKSISANGIIRTPDWLTCSVKEVFYDHDHCPFVNIYRRASYDG
jgi:hypothetical protein